MKRLDASNNVFRYQLTVYDRDELWHVWHSTYQHLGSGEDHESRFEV